MVTCIIFLYLHKYCFVLYSGAPPPLTGSLSSACILLSAALSYTFPIALPRYSYISRTLLMSFYPNPFSYTLAVQFL